MGAITGRCIQILEPPPNIDRELATTASKKFQGVTEMNMPRFFVAVSLASTLLVLSGQSHAATVNFNASGQPTGVDAIVYNGNTYNVTFNRTYNATEWSTMLDFTSLADATGAATALANELQTAGAGISNFGNDLFIPYLFDGSTLFVEEARWEPAVGWFATSNSWGVNDEELPAADWELVGSASAVPLPAALPLFGAGLALFGFAGWHRRRSASP